MISYDWVGTSASFTMIETLAKFFSSTTALVPLWKFRKKLALFRRRVLSSSAWWSVWSLCSLSSVSSSGRFSSPCTTGASMRSSPRTSAIRAGNNRVKICFTSQRYRRSRIQLTLRTNEFSFRPDIFLFWMLWAYWWNLVQKW